MMNISGTPAADQARLLSNRFDMFAIANPTRCRQRQYAFVDNRGSAPLSASTERTDWRFSLRCRGPAHWLGRKASQEQPKSLLHVFGVGRSQTIFGGKNPMRPGRGVFGRIEDLQLGDQLFAQYGRRLRLKPWTGRS
jgi:hypothetical protein